MTVHFLGTGAAVSDLHRSTTMLAVEHGGQVLVIDCGESPARALLRAGLSPVDVDALILTHEHPDHIGGLPLFVEQLWLMGRRAPIPVYGLAATLRVARAVYESFDYRGWEGLPAVIWNDVAAAVLAPVFERGPFQVSASPVDHPVPTIGLRIAAGGRVLAYSADTSRCDRVVELARGADLLVHEGTGSIRGVHASPEEAADVAAEAGVERLVLVHIPLGASDDDLAGARAIVEQTTWAEEGGHAVV